MVAVDDVGDRSLGVLVQPLITHADALVVGQAGGALRQQQLQDVVAVLAAGDRPEYPDFGHQRGEPVEDAQGDSGLTGFAFR